jgi:hypothetical protein
METISWESRSVGVCQHRIDLVVERRTGHETINSANIESTILESLELAKGSVCWSSTAVSLSEAERAIEFVDVVTLAAGYQSVLGVVSLGK